MLLTEVSGAEEEDHVTLHKIVRSSFQACLIWKLCAHPTDRPAEKIKVACAYARVAAVSTAGEVNIKFSFVQKHLTCTAAYSKCKNSSPSHINSVVVLNRSGLHHVDLALKYNMWESASFFLFSMY